MVFVFECLDLLRVLDFSHLVKKICFIIFDSKVYSVGGEVLLIF